MGAETFRFTIDGIEVEASTGQSVIEACDAAGIYIPRLCYHPDLEPAGQLPGLHLQDQWPQQRGLRDPGRSWHGDRERHAAAHRRPAHHHRNAVRRRQSSLPLLRGERGLRTAGARLSARHGCAAPALSVAGTRRSTRRIPTSISIMTAASSARAASAPRAWRTARPCSASKAAASPCG